jgi:hypothetical protein
MKMNGSQDNGKKIVKKQSSCENLVRNSIREIEESFGLNKGQVNQLNALFENFLKDSAA